MQQKNRNTTKKKKRRTRNKINAVSVWIALEVVAAIVIAVMVFVHLVYGDVNDEDPTYKVPTALTL